MARWPGGNGDRWCECCRCVKCPRLGGLRLFSRTVSGINRWLNRAMIDQTDFIVLYRELGVDPDCSVDGLRLAYRRRVADLHPDRGGDSDEDELKSLNQRYAAALDFHRHYGRLPGAPPAPSAQRRRAPVAQPRRLRARKSAG